MPKFHTKRIVHVSGVLLVLLTFRAMELMNIML